MRDDVDIAARIAIWESRRDQHTTELPKLQGRPNVFTWGPVLKWYHVGPYAIAEYAKPLCFGRELVEIGFHVWVDGRDTRHGFPSLDAALAGAIAYRHEGANHAADQYFIRALAAEAIR